MRIPARILLALFFLFFFAFSKSTAYAQTTPSVIQATTTNNFLTPNVDSSVPQNHHEYTQIVVIDVLSALMCQLTGIDPTNPRQPCLGVNPMTGKIGLPPTNTPQFGKAQTGPQLGGALGVMTNFIAALYTPAVSTTQYVDYLSSNFGIVKPTYAASGTASNNCSSSPLGYGFCGLAPIFSLWVDMRDFAYALLTILFIVIGLGVMLRFRVDPRTVMTLQNQIPRVIIAILLITFSYAISGAMIDLMWTVTYAGINFITSTTNTQVAVSCDKNGKEPLSQAAEQTLLDEPLSFTNLIFKTDCNGSHNGIFTLSDSVSKSFGDLVVQVIADLFHFNLQGSCDLNPVNLNLTGCIQDFFLWLTEQLVKIIIIVVILVALFRLWFQLLTSYVTFLIFVIMGPLWIVFGLIPGRPLGFEKWLRIIFANLAAFPLAAFLLVFARVLMDAASQNTVLGAATSAGANASGVLAAASGPGSNPQSVFIPPLVGNPNVATFTSFLALGAIMIAPTIPSMIKERMKATGQGKYGAMIAAGLGSAASAVTSPGRKAWEGLNRRNPTTGQAEGSLAIMRQRLWQKTPFFGRRAIAKRRALWDVHATGGDFSGYRAAKRRAKEELGGNQAPSRFRNPFRRNPQQGGNTGGSQNSGGSGSGSGGTPPEGTT